MYPTTFSRAALRPLSRVALLRRSGSPPNAKRNREISTTKKNEVDVYHSDAFAPTMRPPAAKKDASTSFLKVEARFLAAGGRMVGANASEW